MTVGEMFGILGFLSTPSARRATAHALGLALFEEISIHALCEEGDEWVDNIVAFCEEFLSTPSARRATVFSKLSKLVLSNFYPRPLRGGRLMEEREDAAP